MKRIFLLCLLLFYGCSAVAPVSDIDKLSAEPIVPLMPDISPDMLSSGYWISKSIDPDALIMDMEDIAIFNEAAAEEFQILKIADYSDNVTGDLIKVSIQTIQGALAKQALEIDGNKLNKSDYKELMQIAGIDNIGKIVNVRFGITVTNVSQKVIPTNKLILRERSSVHFDRNQMSALDAATPLAILWESTDGEWYYARSSNTVGWVPVNSVALCSREDIQHWENPDDFVIVTRHKTAVYLNPEMTDYFAWYSIGNKLISNGEHLLVPARGIDGKLIEYAAYVQPESIHKGYVPYTSRNMLNMAFEMLNAPYGWGGMYGEQDCSAFMMKIFAAAGIQLPRNSYQQGKTGTAIFTQNTEVISARDMTNFFGIPGATLIQFPGHVMLYIGSIGGDPYVIHSIWAFVEDENGKNALRLPARIVVSNLNLSATTNRGVYFQRITNVRNIMIDIDAENDSANQTK